jgi:multiple sugar transport system substrate-binding protein
MTVTAVLLAGALVAGACGNDDDSEDAAATGGDEASEEAVGEEGRPFEGETVRFWIMNNGPSPVEDTERIIAPFEEETGIDVEVELVGWDVQFDRIRNAAVTGEAPDVTQAGTTQVPFFASLGGFEDLSDRVDDLGGPEVYPEGVWATTQVKDQDGIWAAPWFTEARAIYYRKDALEAAGVDAETAFTDWDAFRSTLEALAEVEEIDGQPIEPFGSPGRQAFDLVHHVMPFVWSNGGAELNDDASESTIASDEAVEATMFFADLLQDGLYSKAELERDGTQVENQFKAGRLATWIGGPWTLASVDREDDTNWTDTARANVGIAPMPEGPGGEAFTFVGGSNLMMFNTSEHKDAAWELIKFLSEPDVQVEYASLMGFYPSTQDGQAEIAAQGENQALFLEAIEQGRTYAAIPQWGEIENAYKDKFGNILDAAAGGGDFSQETVRAELEAAQQEANELLAQSQ